MPERVHLTKKIGFHMILHLPTHLYSNMFAS